MTQTMRERLIRAVYPIIASAADDDGTGFTTWDEWVARGVRPVWENQAAAAVDAILAELREPDEAMHEAGSTIIDRGQGHPHDRPLPTLRNAFTAMIDAVRSSKTTP